MYCHIDVLSYRCTVTSCINNSTYCHLGHVLWVSIYLYNGKNIFRWRQSLQTLNLSPLKILVSGLIWWHWLSECGLSLVMLTVRVWEGQSVLALTFVVWLGPTEVSTCSFITVNCHVFLTLFQFCNLSYQDQQHGYQVSNFIRVLKRLIIVEELNLVSNGLTDLHSVTFPK